METVNFERVNDYISDAERVILLSKENIVRKMLRDGMASKEEKKIFKILDDGIEELKLSY